MTQRIVSFSGGKDSTATLLLALDEQRAEGGEVRCVFADTGNEHESTVEYVQRYIPEALGIEVETVRVDFAPRFAARREYIRDKWPGKGVPAEVVERALRAMQPTGNPFLDICILKGRFPSRMAQFCTQELKRYPLDALMLDALASGAKTESWRGIRRDESTWRRNTEYRTAAAEGYDIVCPIVDWTAQQTVDFVLSRGLKLNALYAQGMTRVGCFPCIHANKSELAEIATRHPAHIDRIAEWEQIVSDASKRGSATFKAFSSEDDPVTVRRLGNIRERVKWARTTRGGKQYDLLREIEGPSCSSVYGLCE